MLQFTDLQVEYIHQIAVIGGLRSILAPSGSKPDEAFSIENNGGLVEHLYQLGDLSQLHKLVITYCFQ